MRELHRCVILRDYRSSNSNQVSDRTVEPFHVSPPDDILHAFDTERKLICEPDKFDAHGLRELDQDVHITCLSALVAAHRAERMSLFQYAWQEK